jgi:VWFA-related protein
MRVQSMLTMGAVAFLLVLRAHAQAPPSFQTEVNYVDVDVIVTDDQDNIVSGLTVDDFELSEEGKPQKIETFSYVDISSPVPVEFTGVDTPVSPDVRSNRDPVTGRMYIIVLDDANIESIHTTRVRQQAREFIEQYFGAGDIASVAYTSGTTNASQDFTGDPQLLLASIDRFVGRRPRSAALEAADKYYEDRLTLSLDPAITPEQASRLAAEAQDSRAQTLGQTAKPTVDIRDFERAQRSINVLNTLRTLSESVSTVRGRRKALVMFSEGLGYQLSDPFGMRSVSDVLRATRNAIDMAARSNVNFYTIDPRGLVGATSDFMQMTGAGLPDAGTSVAILEEVKTSQNSLHVLAEETGGFAAVDSNSFASAFERIVDRNSRYYVLGYRTPEHPHDGAFHAIEVRLKRPGLRVRARRGYMSPREATVEDTKRDDGARRTREARRPGGDHTSLELRSVLADSIQRSGLDMFVHAAPFRSSGKDASVALAIEVHSERLLMSLPGANPSAANKLELSFFSINEQGQASLGTRKELDLAMKPEISERVKAHGIRLNPRISLPPGRYQLRIGARETVSGDTGSVFYDLIVPDFRKEVLEMSGLLLTSVAAQQAPTAEADPIAARQLPGAATSRRTFPSGDTLAVYAEFYDNSSSPQPRQIDVLVRLISGSGVDVFTAKDSMASNGNEPPNVFAQFALQDLAAGVYLLRVEGTLRGTDTALVARETLITVAE